MSDDTTYFSSINVVVKLFGFVIAICVLKIRYRTNKEERLHFWKSDRWTSRGMDQLCEKFDCVLQRELGLQADRRQRQLLAELWAAGQTLDPAGDAAGCGYSVLEDDC